MPRGSARTVALTTGRQAPGPLVVLTYPLEGDILLTESFTVTWTVPVAQAIYMVQIYSDADGLTVVYDSGFVASSIPSHAATPTLTSGETYYIRVFSWGDDGSSSESAIVAFTTAFATASNVAGVALRVVGGNCSGDPFALPGIRLTWGQVTPSVNETFVSYQVRRRLAGDTAAYTVIASIDAVATLTYTDYAVAPSFTYEYAVVWTAEHTTDGTLVSAVQSPAPFERVDFDYAFVHEVATPGEYVRFEAHELSVEAGLDMELSPTWGRSLPTAFVGEALSTRITLRGLDQLRRDPNRWPKLLSLLTRQSTAGATLCLRSGRDRELYFVALPRLPKSVNRMTFIPTLEMQEVHYEESAV